MAGASEDAARFGETGDTAEFVVTGGTRSMETTGGVAGFVATDALRAAAPCWGALAGCRGVSARGFPRDPLASCERRPGRGSRARGCASINNSRSTFDTGNGWPIYCSISNNE
ncbi:hypothetical protein ES703_38807 [subsurface metagenome]